MINLTIDTRQFDDQLENLDNLVKGELVFDLANETLNETIHNFQHSKYFNTQWEPVDGKTRALVESGNLFGSIRIFNVDNDSFTIGTDVEYASIHNEGGVISVTDRMKKFMWYKYKETGNSMYKAIALSTHVTIPQRQFIATDENDPQLLNFLNLKIDELIQNNEL